MRTFQLAPVAAVLAFSLTGCFVPGLEDGEDVASATQADESTNSLTANSLTANSLTANSLTANSLTANSLTANSLTANSLTANALTDPAARTVLKYIVGCALPAGQSIDVVISGTSYHYDGQLGLAPSWGVDQGSSGDNGERGSACDGKCIEAVSACVLARVNHLGQTVPISVRGAGLTAAPSEASAYPNVDGTYYGNIFTSPQIRYACLPPGVTQLTRVCGSSLSGCVVTSQGPCEQVCGKVKSDGSYKHCSDASASAKFDRSISVYLQ